MDEQGPGAASALIIVDERPVDLHALSELLKKQGHEVRHVSSGEVAPQPAAGTPLNAEFSTTSCGGCDTRSIPEGALRQSGEAR